MYDFLHKTLNIPYELSSVKFGDWSDSERPVVVLIHGIGVNHRIWSDTLAQLDDLPVLAVDLLGFGESRKPDWLQYSLADHAKALQKTIRRKAPNREVILCGHSLGSLVAIEYEKLFPRDVSGVVLCSPPIYQPEDMTKRPLKDALVKAAGKRFLRAFESAPQFLETINQYRIAQPNFKIANDGKISYLRSARNSILLQTSFADVLKLPDVPIAIVYGTLDAVMVPKNLKAIKRLRKSKNTTITTVVSGHEIRKRYATTIADTLKSLA